MHHNVLTSCVAQVEYDHERIGCHELLMSRLLECCAGGVGGRAPLV
jgi:hypothetical protein